VHYSHDDDISPDSLAEVSYRTVGRVATINLAPRWNIEPTEQQLKKTAFHEICELFLARINILARDRYCNEENIDEEIHNIVRTLENVIFLKNNG
jgi:hypothetical protein